jgi:hypothetical protein
MSNFEIAMGSTSFGMHHSFRDSLAVEVCEFVDEVEIGDDHWTELTCCHRVLVIVNWLSGGSC